MHTILTILTFPMPIMAIWRVQDLGNHNQNPQPVAFQVHTEPKAACEMVLPVLWNGLQDHRQSITHVATLSGPGPFTALRAGQAFAQGFIHGSDVVSLFYASLFDLIPDFFGQSVILDTGGGHGINRLGELCILSQICQDSGNENPGRKDHRSDVHLIDHTSCSLDQALGWSYTLAGKAVNFSA